MRYAYASPDLGHSSNLRVKGYDRDFKNKFLTITIYIPVKKKKKTITMYIY